MPPLTARIREALVKAIKAKDSNGAAALRLLSARVKNYQIDKGSEPTDDEVIGLIQKQVKKQKEEIDFLVKAGRTERAAEERAKLEVLLRFLPPELSDDQVREAILSVVDLNQIKSTPFGQLMALLVKKLAGQVPNSRLADVLKQLKANA